ncbi:MAG: YfhO family protein [Planctomycetes bacterium]|nr:YfhO family protein [Planctomycetota bacterium]
MFAFCALSKTSPEDGASAVQPGVWAQATTALEHEHALRTALPVWDPSVGFGAPRLAVPAAAVASPLAALFFSLPSAAAAALTIFAELFALGWFTWLFLRRLRLTPVACVLGAIVFMFSGHSLVYLGDPRVAVAIALPAGLWALERLAQRMEDSPARNNGWKLAHPAHMLTFAASAAFGLAAGDPETFACAALVWFVYGAGRLLALRALLGARSVLGFCGLLLLTAGACAAFLLPFVEYLGESRVLSDRLVDGLRPLARAAWPRHFFPGLTAQGTEPNAAAAVAATVVGSLALFLALLAPFVVRGRRALTLFVILGCAWVLVAYDVLGVQAWIESVPALALIDVERSVTIFHIAVAVGAAFAVHHLVERAPRSSGVAAVGVLAAAFVMAAVFRAGATEFLLGASRALAGDSQREALSSSGRYVSVVIAWFAAGAACSAMAWLTVSRRHRTVAVVGCIVVVLAQQMYLPLQHQARSADAASLASESEAERVLPLAAEKRCVFLGGNPIPPTSGSLRGAASIANIDGIGIARFDHLRANFFPGDVNGTHVSWIARRGIELFGIERVLTRDDWIGVDTFTGFVEPNEAREFLTRPLAPDADVEFEFRCCEDRTSALRVCFATNGAPLAQTIELSLDDPLTGEHIAARTLPHGLAPDAGSSRALVALHFDESAGRKGRLLRLTMRSADGIPARAWSLVARRDWSMQMNRALWRRDGVYAPRYDLVHPIFDGFTTRQGGVQLRGDLLFDTSAVAHVFHEAEAIAPLRVLAPNDPVAAYHTVSRAWVAADEDEAFAAVHRAVFDPRQIVVLEGVDPAHDCGPNTQSDVNEPVELLARDDRTVRLRTTRARPGWLVAAIPWYPGWRVRVNGVETPLVRANYAFVAVALEAGTSEIVLRYEPVSMRAGFWISIASILLIVAWIFRSRRAAHLPRDLGSA